MSTDTKDPGDGEGMTKIDVRVPTRLVEQIDEEYAERGYTSRSEAIRDALRAWSTHRCGSPRRFSRTSP